MARAKGFTTYRDYDWMYERYVVKKFSMTDIAKELNCSIGCISGWMDRLGIEKRSFSETAKLIWDDERRERFSKIAKEISSRPEVKAKRSAAARGRKQSPETVRKRAIGIKAAHARGAFGPDTVEKQRKARKAAWDTGTYDGVHQTPEYRAKMSKVHSSPETKRKVSEGVSAAHQRSEVKEKHKKAIQASWTESRRKEQSAISSEINNREEVKKKKSIGVSKAWANGNYSGAKFSSTGPTWIEKEVAKVLSDLHFNFIPEWSPDGFPGRFDFYLSDFAVTIECQGDYWHNEGYHPGITKRDQEKHDWAIENGYTPIELWEEDIGKHGAKLLLVEEMVGEGIL